MKKSVIVCDECNNEFNPHEIEFKIAKAKIEEKDYEVTYYKCPVCERVYVVCMLDYWGKKLQDKYVDALDQYRSAINKKATPAILEQKHTKMEYFKQEALAYQQEILHIYGNSLPEEIFV